MSAPTDLLDAAIIASVPVQTTTLSRSRSESARPVENLSSLGKLPDELLLRIFDHFEWDQQTLRSLCLVSEKLHFVAKEVLHRSIDLTGLGSSRIHKILLSSFSPRSLPTTRNLRLHFYGPESTRTKRKENVVPNYWKSFGYDSWSKFLDDCGAYIDSVPCIKFPKEFIKDVWKESLKSRETAVMAGLLLIRSANLEYLDIRVFNHNRLGLYTPTNPLGIIFAEHPEKPDSSPFCSSFWPQVTHLRIHMDQGDFLAIHFPSLQTLEVDSVSPAKCKWFCSYPRLKKLIVRHDPHSDQETNAPDFQKILDLINWLACVALTSFELLVSYGPSYTREQTRNFRLFVSKLEFLSGTLESLKIDIIGPHEAYIYEKFNLRRILAGVAPVRSLCRFKELRTVRFIQCGLIKPKYGRCVTSLLPPSLEFLTIYWPDENLAPWLQELLSSLDKFQLKEMNLRLRDPSGEYERWLTINLSDVLDGFRQRGVSVNVVQEEVEFQKAPVIGK